MFSEVPDMKKKLYTKSKSKTVCFRPKQKTNNPANTIMLSYLYANPYKKATDGIPTMFGATELRRRLATKESTMFWAEPFLNNWALVNSKMVGLVFVCFSMIRCVLFCYV